MGTQAKATPSDKPTPCLARQPILTGHESVIGYEVLFRESAEDQRPGIDPESGIGTIIETLHVIGLDVLCDGKLAFVKCNQRTLEQECFLMLPPGEVVVEMQGDVAASKENAGRCQRLKEAGYTIALDDFVPDDPRNTLVPFADFIKVNIKKVRPEQCALLAARHGGKSHPMLAQNVETRQDFVTATSCGFTHFQGYFFRQPERMRARKIPANQATYLRLLQSIAKQEPDFGEIEDLVKREPSLCYRLLRHLNSPLLGLTSPVHSVRHALNLLGERELVRWIRMATTLAMGQERPSDLVASSLVRARFCELLGAKVKHGESDLFLMGMLSLMDSILEVPIGVVIEKLALDNMTRAQLLGRKTGGTTALSPIYDLMAAREAGDWEKVTHLGKQLNISVGFVNKAYNEAMQWARQMTSNAESETPAAR